MACARHRRVFYICQHTKNHVACIVREQTEQTNHVSRASVGFCWSNQSFRRRRYSLFDNRQKSNLVVVIVPWTVWSERQWFERDEETSSRQTYGLRLDSLRWSWGCVKGGIRWFLARLENFVKFFQRNSNLTNTRSNVITPIRVGFLNLQGTSLSPLCATQRTTSTFILESQKPSVILQPRDQACRHEKRSVRDSMYLRALLHCIYQALRNILVYEVPRDTFTKFRYIKKEIRMKEISGVDKGTSWYTRDINKKKKKKEGNVKKGNPKSRRCYPSPLCLRYITEQNCVDVHEIGNGAELRHSTGDNTRSSIAGSRWDRCQFSRCTWWCVGGYSIGCRKLVPLSSLSLSLSLCRYLACSCIDHLFLVGDKSTRSALGRSVERLSNDRINHSYTRVCPETAGSRLFEKRDIGLKVDRFGLPSFAIERYSCVASLASFVACAVARMEK